MQFQNLLSFIKEVIIPFIISGGFITYWHKFKQEKRIENLSINAKEALSYVTNIEIHYIKLKTTLNKSIREPYIDNSHQHKSSQNLILEDIIKLQNSLLLISKDENLKTIVEVKEIYKYVIKIRDILLQINNNPQSYQSIDLIQELGNLDNTNYQTITLQCLKEILLKVYYMENKKKCTCCYNNC